MKKFLSSICQFFQSSATKKAVTENESPKVVDHSDVYERLGDAEAVDIGMNTEGRYDASFQFPPNFDPEQFLKEMIDRYYLFNKAWCENNIPALEIYVTDELYQGGLIERASITHEINMSIYELDNEITYADFDGETAKITVLFNGRFQDNVKGVDNVIKEKWYMERTYEIEDSLWFVIGLKTNL